MQSDNDKLKYLMNLSPLEVLSMSLLKRLVMLTKKQDPKKARKIPSCIETLVSASFLATVPNAKTKLPQATQNSNHIEPIEPIFVLSFSILATFDLLCINMVMKNFNRILKLLTLV